MPHIWHFMKFRVHPHKFFWGEIVPFLILMDLMDPYPSVAFMFMRMLQAFFSVFKCISVASHTVYDISLNGFVCTQKYLETTPCLQRTRKKDRIGKTLA